MTESSKPQLSFTTGVNGLHGVLRVDRIRTDTLVQLVAKWGETDARDDVLDALDNLADIVHSARQEGELDAALEEVEDQASMDDAHIEVSMADLLRLRAELDAVIAATAGRFNPGRGASEIKHPAMRATRLYLKRNPLPEQGGRRTA